MKAWEIFIILLFVLISFCVGFHMGMTDSSAVAVYQWEEALRKTTRY